MNKKHVYIYNIRQANFFYQEGVQLVEIGKGNRGDAYFKFVRDEKCEDAFSKWSLDERNITINMYG